MDGSIEHLEQRLKDLYGLPVTLQVSTNEPGRVQIIYVNVIVDGATPSYGAGRTLLDALKSLSSQLYFQKVWRAVDESTE